MLPALHLRSSLGLYGAEQMLLDLCSEQARRGSGPTLAAFAPRPGEPAVLRAAQARGVATYALPCRGRLDLDCLRRLRRRLRRACADGARVLHCHDYKSVVYGWLAASGLPLARVATVHGWVDETLRAGLYRRIEQRTLRAFDRVCAVSDALAGQLARAGIPAARLRRIGNGIDVMRFRAVPPPAATGRPLQLGVAARLSPEKNLEQLIDAVAACTARGKPLQLTILGEGPQRERLEARAGALLAQGVIRMPGAREGLEHWYPTLDAFVLPSLREGMPMTVLEALSCGCPVLASAVGALPQVLDGLPGCRLLPAGDGEALREAILAVEPRTRPHLPLRRRVVERHSLADMADRYETVYHEALAA